MTIVCLTILQFNQLLTHTNTHTRIIILSTVLQERCVMAKAFISTQIKFPRSKPRPMHSFIYFAQSAQRQQ